MDMHYQKVGIFGGTFDPIHNGHLRVALHIEEKLKLNHIYFVPAYRSPYKTDESFAAPHHRSEMVKRAIIPFPHFSVSEFELNKKGVSYTIDTLKHYQGLLSPDAELYFILGTDAFLGIAQWKQVADLFAIAHLVVVSRPGYQFKPLSQILKNDKLAKEFVALSENKEYQHFTGHHIYFFELPTMDISSSELRDKISQHEPYSSFVPKEVQEYIQAQHLYENKDI
ncbi:MAG: nicotinate-nucleotide adenylyltransferase [Deltaproteobacteria bacterium]|nr:nicotinate-nucleotide adenylyltransferase [Deltaproteobacteria bacterium]